LQIIYDPNILLQILRDDRSISKLQTIYNLYGVEESISLVTVAEIRSLSIQFRWGIASTASVYECKLLTMDLDFGHLRDEFVDVVYIMPSTFMS
jgi:hypothetical protein